MKDKTNVFDLNEPDTMYCQVDAFSSSHNTLALTLRNSGRKLTDTRLIFSRVVYYEGPMYWQGARFRIATVNEIKSFPEIFNFPDYRETLILFVSIPVQGIQTRMLALLGFRQDGEQKVISINASVLDT